MLSICHVLVIVVSADNLTGKSACNDPIPVSYHDMHCCFCVKSCWGQHSHLGQVIIILCKHRITMGMRFAVD